MHIRTNEQRIKEFLRYDAREIAYDESFQRPPGCWTSRNYNGYIQSVFRAYSSTPITVACIEKCLRHSRRVKDEVSEQYYAKHSSRGNSYISLDGQHRTICLIEFVENKFAYSGEAIDDDGNVINVKNKFYKDLPKSFRDGFINKNIVFQKFERHLRHELPLVFKGLNSNSALTDQQLRNAQQTPFASWIRKIATKYEEMLKSFFAKNSFQKMQPHEWISKLFMHVDNNKSDVGRRALDHFYRKGDGDASFQVKYSLDAKKKVEDILMYLNQLHLTSKKEKIGNNNLLVISLVLDKILLKDGITHSAMSKLMEDGDSFIKKVTDANAELIKMSKQQEVNDQNNGIEKPTVSYYHEKSRLNWSGHARKDRQEALFKKLIKDLSLKTT